MEIKEAIKIINQYDMNFHWNDGEPIPAEQLAEAFDLAIAALEQQEQVNTQSVNLTHTTYPNALESLNILESAKDENGCVPMSLVRLAFRNVLEQDRWIPITERMPEENDIVLVTVSGEEVRGVRPCEWKDSMALAVWTNQWNLVNANLVSYRISAWRPLPELYTEDEA